MKLFNFFSLGFSTLLLGLISTPVIAASITIDRFTDVDNDVQFVEDSTADGNSESDTDGLVTPLTDVIGGTRTMEINKNSGSTSRFNNSLLFVDPTSNANQASFSTASGTQGSFSFTYDGNGFGSGIDLTDGGINDSFVIDTLFNDVGIDLNFEVSDGINTAILSQSLAAGETGASYFPFADFSDPTPLSQATSIRIYSSNEPEGLDFQFRNFESTRSIQQVPFEFNPIMGIMIYGSLFGIHKIKKVMLQK